MCRELLIFENKSAIRHTQVRILLTQTVGPLTMEDEDDGERRSMPKRSEPPARTAYATRKPGDIL